WAAWSAWAFGWDVIAMPCAGSAPVPDAPFSQAIPSGPAVTPIVPPGPWVWPPWLLVRAAVVPLWLFVWLMAAAEAWLLSWLTVALAAPPAAPSAVPALAPRGNLPTRLGVPLV